MKIRDKTYLMGTTKAEDSIFKWAILLLPYDAIHYLIPSQYAPVSIYPFFFLLVYMITNRRWHLLLSKSGRILSSLFLYGAFISIFTNLAYVGSFPIYVEFILTSAIGVMIFFVADMYLHEKFAQDGGRMLEYIVQLLGKAYYLPLVVGVIEFLSFRGILPLSIIDVLHAVFGGWQTGRPSITTYEASWASMHMLIAMTVYFVLARMHVGNKRTNIFCLCVSAFLFVTLMSAQGMGTLVLAGVLYLLLSVYIDSNFLKFFTRLAAVTAVVAVAGVVFYRMLQHNPDTYMAARVLNFSTLDAAFINDSSVFVRIGFLLIHLIICKEHMLLGVGGGSFMAMLPAYIYKYYPETTRLPEIDYILSGGSPSEVSIYFRTLSEFGLLGASLFIWLIIHCIKHLKYLNQGQYVVRLVCLFVAVLLAMPIQFGSWSYAPLWLCLAFANNLGRPNNRINMLN